LKGMPTGTVATRQCIPARAIAPRPAAILRRIGKCTWSRSRFGRLQASNNPIPGFPNLSDFRQILFDGKIRKATQALCVDSGHSGLSNSPSPEPRSENACGVLSEISLKVRVAHENSASSPKSGPHARAMSKNNILKQAAQDLGQWACQWAISVSAMIQEQTGTSLQNGW